MAIGKISGPMLQTNLERQGVDLSIDGNLIYADVTNHRVGIYKSNPQYTFDVNGNARLANILLLGNTISSTQGKVNFGSNANVVITGGQVYSTIYTDGTGNLNWANLNQLAVMSGLTSNSIQLGRALSPTPGLGTSSLTTGLTVADAIQTLDNILGNITNASGNTIHVVDITGTLKTNNQPYITDLNNITINGNLTVQGNTFFSGYSDLTVSDSIINLHTSANLAPWTYNDGKDIGFKFHYYDYQDSHAFLGLANDTKYLEFYDRGIEGTGNIFQGNTYGTIKAGGLLLANTTQSTSSTTGALRVTGGAGIGGNLYVQGNTTIGGNLTVNGDIVGFSANTITMFDSLLYIASNNTTSDLVDIGLVGHYNDGTTSAHTGIIRDATTKEYYFFKGYTAEPTTNDININDASFKQANLNVANLRLNNGLNVNSNGLTVNSGNLEITVPSGLTNIYSTSALLIPSGNVAQRPVAPVAGQIRYNIDTGVVEYFGGIAWVPLSNSVDEETFNGDGATATYTLKQTTTAIGILVSLNGTLQQPNFAYTVTGNQITFAEIPQTTDVVTIRYMAAAVTVNVDKSIIDTPPVTVGTTLTIVDSWDKGAYRSARYTISSSNSTDATMAEVMLLQNNSTSFINTFGVLNTGSNTLSFSSNISGNTVNLLVQGTTSLNRLTVQKTYFNL
jgi:hypothetical protein